MKLKSLLPASILLAALASAASAQQRPPMFRQGDVFRGRVKSARIEHAAFKRVGGVLVEGSRRLSTVSTYSPDGRRKQDEGYGPDGSVLTRYVHVYDDAGNEIEMSMFDGKGGLNMRRVNHPAAGETMTYNGDGSLRERRVVTLRPDGKLAEVRLYDGDGALKSRNVNTKENGVSVWSNYGPDGVLRREIRHSLNFGGPHHTELQTFAPDGSPVWRRVSDVDANVYDLRATEEGSDGGPPRKTRETREYDSHKNLLKLTSFKWNAETGEYEPTAVSYYTLTYYR